MLVTLFSVKTMESLQIRGAAPFWMESIVSIKASYPKIGENSFKCALWTLKQQLTLNMRAHWGIFNLSPVNVLVPLPVADPGFPQGGGELPRGAPTYNFVNFSQKLHKIERIWTPRAKHVPCTPLLDMLLIGFGLCTARVIAGSS